MRWRSVALLPLLVLPFVALTSLTSTSAVNQYVEDFSTRSFCDVLNTTAEWDTLAGEIRLPLFEVTLAGSYDYLGEGYTVAIAGDHAYVANGSGGLVVLDISDPTTPAWVVGYNTPGRAEDVAISGDHACVADYTSGLQVIDISNPTSPTLAGSCDTPGFAGGVAISGDHAYVADGAFGLQVFDISDPSAPTLAGSYDTPDHAWGVAVAGDYAFVADDGSGLQVLDIGDPTAPALAGSYNTPGNAMGVTISGDRAYVADYGSGLQVLDISDPTSPTLAGSCGTLSNAREVAIAGDHAYVADDYSGVQVVDISDPAAPALTGSYATPDRAWGIALAGDHAYAVDRSSVQVLRISDPTTSTLAGSYDTPDSAYDVALAGDHAYVADDAAIVVLDISDPTAPVLSGSYDAPISAFAVAIAGDHAYVASYDNGLIVLDIGDPTAPALAGSYVTSGLAFDIALAGDHAYVADDYSGLQVLDISDPTAPTLAGSYDTPGEARGVAVSGDNAYVADHGGGLVVLDVGDPTAPALAGSYNPGPCPGCFALDVAVSGDHAYVASFGSGIWVVDVSDPAAPALAGSYDTPGTAQGVLVAGDNAYVADYSTLQVLDISDPTAPALAGSYDALGAARSVAVAGDYACVADGGSGLQVIQVRQRDISLDANAVRSVDVELAGDEVLHAKLNSTQTDSIAWELSADGGGAWGTVIPGGDWYTFASAGSDLRWRSSHLSPDGLVNPTCTELTIDWLYRYPVLTSVVDIPNDQGRQVSLTWTRSGHDFPGDATPITEYAVFRRIDYAAASASEPANSEFRGHEPKPALADPGQPDAYPPGSWHFITTVPAFTEEEYSVVVPTLEDSTITGGVHYSVFFVRAATGTPGVYFDAPPDSGYSLDNLAPAVPRGLSVDYSATESELAWEESEDADFQYFRVYRGTDPDFAPAPENLVHMTVDTGWIDSVAECWLYHYKITALDFSGNESDAASPETVTGLDDVVIPARFALHRSVPNPFRFGTTIAYDVPSGGGEVRLAVYDVAGRLVRTVVDGLQTPGRKSVSWDGRDEGGRAVGSGVYYCRLEAPGFEESIKITVLR